MRISEILYGKTQPIEMNQPDSQPGRTPALFRDPLAKLATAFTRRGVVKHLWNLNGSEDELSGPVLPDRGADLVPSDTSEPSWGAEPVETGPPAGSVSAPVLGDAERY
jgi:hypothetical protein